MINKTIGTGGDYSNLGAAWAAIVGTTLSENLTWDIISSQTVSAWEAGSVDINGYSFTITCSASAGYHNGIPTVGYTITNTVDINFTLAASAEIGEFLLERVHIVGGSVNVNQLYSYPSAITGQNITVRNILFENGTYFLIQGLTSDSFNVSNIKIWDCVGASSVAASFRINIILYEFTGSSAIENITLWNCYGGVSGGAMFYIQSPIGWLYSIKNVAACDPAASTFCFSGDRTSLTFNNCADTDTSLATYSDISCITVLSNSEFESLDDSSASFLKLKSAGTLGSAGAIPINITVDIAGLPIPNGAGQYPIGCHALLYIPEGVRLITHAGQDNATCTIEIAERQEGEEPKQLVVAARGCMGTATIVCETGKPPRIDFHFKGVLDSITTRSYESMLTPASFDASIPEAMLAATISLYGVTLPLDKFTLGLNNVIELSSDPSSGSGYDYARVVMRHPTLELSPDMQVTDDIDWLYNQTTNTTGEFCAIIGSGLTISAPVAQIIESYKPEDGNGIVKNNLKLFLQRSSGDDELKIVQGDE